MSNFRFDVLVNGGGAVTLQFQRAHFEPLTVTVPVLWNQVVVLDPIIMTLKDQEKQIPKEGKWQNRIKSRSRIRLRKNDVTSPLYNVWMS